MNLSDFFPIDELEAILMALSQRHPPSPAGARVISKVRDELTHLKPPVALNRSTANMFRVVGTVPGVPFKTGDIIYMDDGFFRGPAGQMLTAEYVRNPLYHNIFEPIGADAA